MDVKIELNESKILQKVTGDKFGLLVSNEWKRLINTESIQIKGRKKLSRRHLGVVDLYTTNILQNALNYTKKKKNPFRMSNAPMI